MEKSRLIQDYAAMITNNQELILCLALSYLSLSLLIRGLTSAFAADEGASPLLNLNNAYPNGDSTQILDLALISPLFVIVVDQTESHMFAKPSA